MNTYDKMNLKILCTMINNVSLRDATLYTERSGRTDAVKFRMVRFCVFAYYTVGIYSEKLTPVWCVPLSPSVCLFPMFRASLLPNVNAVSRVGYGV